jgi:hypothetical protein
MSDHDEKDRLTAGDLFRTLQELGLSPECVQNIAKALTGLVKELFAPDKQARLELAGRIRIFCQKKIIDDAALTKSMSPPEQDKQAKPIFLDAKMNQIGGWGYFIIERGEDLPPYSSAICQSSIYLYLYKEGE